MAAGRYRRAAIIASAFLWPLFGGTSLVPCIQRLLVECFGRRAVYERPFDAVARGAATYAAGLAGLAGQRRWSIVDAASEGGLYG